MPTVPMAAPYDRFNASNLKIAGIFTILYLSWIGIFVGARLDHFAFLGFLLIMFFTNKLTRNVVLGFGFFVIYWILYDGMRVIPNYEVNPVHVLEPFNLEKSLFGLNINGAIITPSEYFMTHKSDFQSILSGILYLTWVPLPLLFALLLFFKNKKLLIHFSFAFLLTNLIGFVIYYLYPAAPPWYYLMHGESVDYSILGNAAQLLEFDRLTGTHIFQNMYNKNANVFAAVPSLHAAYPIVLFYFGLKYKVHWLSILFFLDIIGIWYAAVYSLHHYIVDLLLGGMCAILSIFVYEVLFNRKGKSNFLDTYTSLIR